MSYPFYYPYFSAREVYPSPLAELDLVNMRQKQLHEEQAEIELAVKLK